MSLIIVKLQSYNDSASVIEKQIIKFLLDNMSDISNYSIHTLSKNVYASPASIVRFSKKLGYTGFKDLKNNLIAESAVKDYTLVEQSKEVSRYDSSSDIIDKLKNKYILAIEETKQIIDTKTLEIVISLFKNAQQIYLFGIGSSFLIAKDFQQKMLRLGKSCHIIEDYHMQFLQSKNVTSKDIAFVFSYSGQTEEIYTCCENIKKNNATLVSITKFSNSKISKISDYCLYTTNSEPIIRTGAFSSRISQLYIVDVIYMYYVTKEYEKSLSTISDTQLIKEEEIDEI